MAIAPKPDRCGRCDKPMTDIWFHKTDDFEVIDICLDCYEKEYGSWYNVTDKDGE